MTDQIAFFGFVLFLSVFLGTFGTPSYAQQAEPDKIFFTSGERVEAVVEEVGPKTVRYRKWSNRSGPVYTTPKGKIHMLLYANGEHDVFTAKETTTAEPGGDDAAQSETVQKENEDAPVATSSTQPVDRGLTSWGLGMTKLTANDFNLGFHRNKTKVMGRLGSGEQPVRYGLGYENIFNMAYFSPPNQAEFEVTTITTYMGPRVVADYAVSDQFVLYSAGTVGIFFSIVDMVELGGGETTTHVDVDGIWSFGGVYFMGEKWGIHGEFRPNRPPAEITIGLTRRANWSGWW